MRGYLLLLVLLPLGVAAQPASRLEQANGLVLWEYPVEYHTLVTFEATITSVVNDRIARRVQPVRPLVPAECQLLAALDGEPWTSETMCADVCEAVGDLTVILRANAPGYEPSDPSNEAHEALTRPCNPTPPRRPPPREPDASTLPGWALGAGAVAITGGSALAGDTSVSLPSLVNPRCVSWKIAGPCLCGFPPSPCLQVEYMEPTFLIEVVKKPGTTAMPFLGAVLKAGLSALNVSLIGGGGAGSSAGAGYTNLHYSEVHVWSFPQIFGGPCTGCAPVNAVSRLLYASEADTAAWRMTTAPLGMPDFTHLPVGTWGPLFPRVGFVKHQSPVVASALQGFRALSIATLPVTGPPTPEAHVVVNPAGNLSACMQLAHPKQTPCLLAGTPTAPPLLWDAGATSVNGTYIYVAWTKRRCCIPPPGTCGITLPPLGLHGENLCPM